MKIRGSLAKQTVDMSEPSTRRLSTKVSHIGGPAVVKLNFFTFVPFQDSDTSVNQKWDIRP